MKRIRLIFILSGLFACPLGAVSAPLRAETQGLNLLPKKQINTVLLGTNAFANDQRFGSIRSQLREVQNTIRLRHIRVLFAWNDDVQPDPDSEPNFSFYDEIVRNIPRRTKALVILTGVPSWMSSSSNWVDGNPRKTFVEKWVKKVASRYRQKRRILGWEVWNEPNWDSESGNTTLELLNSPTNYIELLSLAQAALKEATPGKKVVSAATTAINQDYPETLDYNEALIEGGVQNYADIFGIHFYGTHLENVLLPGGVDDFLETVSLPIWVTESGAKGVNEQLDYAQRVWPFLLGLSPKIKRIYQYQFTESSSASETYGLKNLTPGFTVSDLYIYLRDR